MTGLYTEIVKELKQACNIEEIYNIMRYYKRSYNITFEQAEYILGQIKIKEII